MEPSTVHYDFIAPRKIVFGWGRRHDVGPLAAQLGKRALIVSGLPDAAAQLILGQLQADLHGSGVESRLIATLFSEPAVSDVDRVAAEVRQLPVAPGDFLLGIGGGSAIDLAKAVAAMAVNVASNTVRDYLEGVGRGLSLEAPPLPVLAMPTTAGTGAEATRNAVIACDDPPVKKSLRDDRLTPQVALVDPELTVSAPPQVTAASGMDAITQLMESYISRRARPIPQALAMQGLRMALPAIVEVVEQPRSQPAREAMSHAALLSGMALANSGLGFAHGVAPALGVLCGVPHGLACAALLPEALRVNREVRQAELARLCHLLFRRSPTHSPQEAVEVLIEEMESLCARLGVPQRLSALGVRREQIPELVRGSRGSSMSANPRELSDFELTAIFERLW